MHLKRSIGLAAAVVAAFALVATAGAARDRQRAHHRQFHFRTPAAALNYLKARGLDVRGMVVQRGSKNYAGPQCPGKAWHCTRARHVIQFGTTDGGSNSFFCSQSYGGPTSSGSPPPVSNPPDTCVIVQVGTTSDNNAKCVEQTSGDGHTQDCEIYQQNVAGKNNATILQLISESQGQSQTGTQNATVRQANGTGSNNSLVTQTILQTTSTAGPIVAQNQQGRQNNTIDQTAASGNQVSTMSQAVVQKATAGTTYSSSSVNPFTAATLTGNQTQFGDGQGRVDQDSTGVSKAFNFQNMLQVESTPSDAAVTQDQTGPFRCCTFQSSNASDAFTLQQSKTQLTSSSHPDNQFLDENGQLFTSGHGHISQFGKQNGVTQTNSCDTTAGGCAAELAIVNGEPPQTCSENGSEPFCCLLDCGGDFIPAHLGAAADTTARLARASRRTHHFSR